MGYQSAAITIETRTASGEPVYFLPDFTTKSVAVYVAGAYVGTFNSRSAAREALNLVEVKVK